MKKNYAISFNDWLKSKSGKFYSYVSAGFALAFSSIPILEKFGLKIENISRGLTSVAQNWHTINLLIHTLFILFVITFAVYKFVRFDNPTEVLDEEKEIWQRLKMNRPETPEPANEEERMELWKQFKRATNIVIRQFSAWWFWCWIAWLVLYSVLSVGTIPDCWKNFANNISSLMFIFMFMTLTVSTSRLGFVYWVRLGIPVVIIFIIEWLIAEPNINISIWFSLFSGVIAGLSMAAFFGSINSKFINVPLWLILVLHIYAAIQPFYVFFSAHFSDLFQEKYYYYVQNIMVVVSFTAFLCKILLFLVVTWILQTGRLAFFVIEEGSLNFKRNETFRKFLKVASLREDTLSTNNFPD